ncbi:ATP-grasp domain-containing protein [Streptomyces sp. NBC_01190]|uniref:ATP-grasp domain-containing protein n=1 Tax=Streptomyces sp. NBC_01190 TaxID=2903767 RepID=UPI003863819F|nr:ATP-grasp domain-containing protein [Streptomyces sp. NBC_01190]
MLRDNPDAASVQIYGTNVDRDAPALTACEVREAEPRYVGDDEYGAFALDFCRRHRIDVLIPPRRLAALAGLTRAFAEIGTHLMCSPAPAIDVLTSKSRTYEAAGAAGVPVPPWRLVSDAEGFRAAAAELAADGERVCFKPAGEYSAFGFRILDDRPLRVRDLLAPAAPLASVGAVTDALRRAADEGESIPEFLVMPYLDGPEVSVDCLSAPGGSTITAIARSKQGRYRLLLDDPAVTAIARRLVGHFELAYLSNVQLRHRAGEPVLLEANPRASAGIFQTAFTGVNLPWAAVRLLLRGDAGPLPRPRLGARIAVTESATEVEVTPVPGRAERPAAHHEVFRSLTGLDGGRVVAPRAPVLAEAPHGEAAGAAVAAAAATATAVAATAVTVPAAATAVAAAG